MEHSRNIGKTRWNGIYALNIEIIPLSMRFIVLSLDWRAGLEKKQDLKHHKCLAGSNAWNPACGDKNIGNDHIIAMNVAK